MLPMIRVIKDDIKNANNNPNLADSRKKSIWYTDEENLNQSEFAKSLLLAAYLTAPDFIETRPKNYAPWRLFRQPLSKQKSKSCDDLLQSNEDMDSQNNLRSARTSSANSLGSSSNSGSNCRMIRRRHSNYQIHQRKDRSDSVSEQMDNILGNIHEGVEHAFNRAKAWSKYCKEILQFVQRRINLETSHAKEVQKLSEQTRSVIQDEEYLPLQRIYVDSFKIELEFYENCTDTMKRLFEYKFVKPLELRKIDHDRKRKELKNLWDKHNKLLADTKTDLRKARQNFQQRETNYKKARESSVKMEMASVDKTKIDKRRKLEEDAMLKREQAYKECKALEKRLEERQNELGIIKAKVLRELRELIYQCDQTTKACTVAYFQALSGLWALLPMQYQSLSDRSRAYEPGKEFMHFVQALPKTTSRNGRFTSSSFSKMSCDDLNLLPQFRKLNGETSDSGIGMASEQRSYSNFSPLFKGTNAQNSNARSNIRQNNDVPVDIFADDTPSINSSCSEVNFEPGATKHKLTRTRSDVGRAYSTAATTHCLERIRMPARCSECDLLTFFHTVQCTDI